MSNCSERGRESQTGREGQHDIQNVGAPKTRRAYVSPAVTELGSVHELTRGASQQGNDGFGGMTGTMAMM